MLQFQNELLNTPDTSWEDRVNTASQVSYALAKKGTFDHNFREAHPRVILLETPEPILGIEYSNRKPGENELTVRETDHKWFSHTYALAQLGSRVIAFGDTVRLHPDLKISTIQVSLILAKEDLVARLGGGVVVASQNPGFYERRFYEEVNGLTNTLAAAGVSYDSRTRIRRVQADEKIFGRVFASLDPARRQ